MRNMETRDSLDIYGIPGYLELQPQASFLRRKESPVHTVWACVKISMKMSGKIVRLLLASMYICATCRKYKYRFYIKY